MILIAELKRIAAKKGVALSVVEKDYALTWILCALSKTKYKEQFIFKGGTALRKVYFPDWRYSEDLDFTVITILNQEELNNFIKEINNYLMEKTGLSITTKSLHLNPEYAQIKVQFVGPLNHENTIKFDLTFNEIVVLQPENRSILSEYSDQEDYSLLAYPLEEILAEKIRSILQRGKTRDYYDVWKILKLHSKQVNKEKIKEVLVAKCKFKKMVCNEELLFEKEKIAEAKQFWEKGLAHQINNLPDFNAVVTECKNLMRELLK
ncbi:MAG TPA: nucleotidyl transferase AbiEii/AbiGii toxin family protein [Candidatus Nanoarchaeia archaeon]|nr:nucleotidyl transferase AbiEii/AbiGii toxin family protein [Candidatus Nanoarchaeia archaeon]